MSQIIYKIAPEALWREAEKNGRFTGAPIDIADGFIHFSTASQAKETAAKHFAGQTDLVLVAIDGMGRRSEPSRVKFWAQAWKAAHRKARAVGWLRS